MLIGQFWGTSDAAGIPAPYCNCEICNEAREKGVPYMRTRSAFRLTDSIMIDLGADAVAQSMKYSSISDLEHILITHTHDDHLNVHMILQNVWNKTVKKTRNYYFTDKAYEIVDLWRNNSWIAKGGIAENSRTIIAEKSPFWTKFSFVAWNTYSIPALRRKIYPQKSSFLGSREVSRDDFCSYQGILPEVILYVLQGKVTKIWAKIILETEKSSAIFGYSRD